MLKYKDYVQAESLEQAYELNQKKGNVIIGGTGWLKLNRLQKNTAIDLSGLGLDQIKEDEQQYTIGCMVTLRQLEKHASLNTYTKGAVKQSVCHIVGTQFRNSVTIGGSIFGRFGFSDVLTVFLVMDCYVELYKGGILPLSEFAKMKQDRDILVNLIVKKSKMSMAYSSFRNQSTDFPVLTCAAALKGNKVRIAMGARPKRAELLEVTKEQPVSKETEKFAEEIAEQFTYGSNLRASGKYRKHIGKVLVKRTILKAEEMSNEN